MIMLKGLPLYNSTITDEIDGVYKISLVDNPAIESDFVLFNEDEKKTYTFSNDEKHVIMGPVMIPDMPIYRNDNGFEFYVTFSKETIEKSMQLFFKNGFQANVSVDHEYDVKDIYVFESYIVDPENGIAPKELDIPAGSWVVAMKCDNEELWDTLKNTDLLHGFSIETINTAVKMSKQEKPEQVEDVKKLDFIDMLLKGKF
jgi:hypothetical protein